jgi:hypothetical protein
MKKIAIATKKTGGSPHGGSPKYTLRISVDLNRDLHALGKIERRQIAPLVRAKLVSAVAEWRKKHPAKSIRLAP